MMPKCCIRRQFTRFWKRASVSTLQPSVVCHVTNVVFLFCNLVNLLIHQRHKVSPIPIYVLPVCITLLSNMV